MKVVIAPDSFKTVAPSHKICKIMDEACKNVFSEVETIINPMADGGEGSLKILSEFLDCEVYEESSYDPLLRPISAPVAVCHDKKLGFLESASVIGPSFLSFKEKRPIVTSSFGFGHIIRQALSKYPDYSWYLALGGTATMDAGKDASEALGVLFIDTNGKRLSHGGASLAFLDLIIPSIESEKLRDFDVTMLCDVKNPLIGQNGAVQTFARQKGATTASMHVLKVGFRALYNALYKVSRGKFKDSPGFGAAGGIPATFNTLFNWKMEWGASKIIEIIGLEEKIKNCDLVVTGEGKIDDASFNGKVVGEIVKLASLYSKPVLVIAGRQNPEFVPSENIILHTIDNPETLPPASEAEALSKIKNVSEKAFLEVAEVFSF